MKRNKLKHNHSSTKAMDKPSVETAWVGIPKLSLSLESTDRKPILIDKHYYNREYKVKDNEIYTIRLGLHSHPTAWGHLPVIPQGCVYSHWNYQKLM